MKHLFLALLALSATVARAEDPLCGTIYSYIVHPHCDAVHACPNWIRLQYAILLPGGKKQNLSTRRAEILEEFAHYRSSGRSACVTGKYDRADDSFRVDSIKPE